MRGGLGRTLLTALLVLAILPLSVVSWYASTRNRLIIQAEITAKLASIAALKEAQISRWVDEQHNRLTILSSSDDFAAIAREGLNTSDSLIAIGEIYNLNALALLTAEGEVTASTDPTLETRDLPLPSDPNATAITLTPPDTQSGDLEIVFVCAPDDSGEGNPAYLAAWYDADQLIHILNQTAELGQTGESYLVTADNTTIPHGYAVDGLPDSEEASNLYENYAGVSVIGTQRDLPALHATLVVEQAQEEAFAGNDAVVAAIITATLIAALAAAVIAAFVTRQITRPIVQLTESTLRLASGDLSERVEVKSRDEIGILAYVFNRMATDLEALYTDLEAKVAQRTQLLQAANYQIQRRAIQMQASLEVGQTITSILDSDRLLEEVARLVRDRFVYSYVAIYTLEEDDCLTLRTSSGSPRPVHGDRVCPADNSAVGRAFREGIPVVETYQQPVSVGPPTEYTRFEAIVPMRMGERSVGVLDVQSTEPEGFDPDDVSVLQNVAYQVTVALENARAYAVERKAAQRLREMDQFKRRFLVNMSHEFRTPLTNIMGFSKLMLKGTEGPLSDQQRQDLEIVHQNGEHLLGLINDLLDISQIEAGLMELQFREINLADLIESVMATTSALVRDKDVELREDVSSDLPTLQGDPARIRQVLLRLLTNAAKFTEKGEITISAQPVDGHVLVSVSDTGYGIRPEDQKRIFNQFEQGTLENGRRPGGAGLGLALSKEFVEMHGGEIWVESRVGEGSTFTFSLPIHPPFESQEESL
jgi:signal transduction histidine kinase